MTARYGGLMGMYFTEVDGVQYVIYNPCTIKFGPLPTDGVVMEAPTDGFVMLGMTSDNVAISTHEDSWQCPHCGRDWHPGPLTWHVSDMLWQHRFDPAYDPAADNSPIVCIGADFQGPNRDSPAEQMSAVQKSAAALTATFDTLLNQ